MSKNKALKVVKVYAKKLRESNFPFASVYLFGSFAKGKAGVDSDIDVAIVSDKLKKFENSFLLRRVRRQVDLRIEPHSFTKKSFSDDSNPLVSEIKKYGILV